MPKPFRGPKNAKPDLTVEGTGPGGSIVITNYTDSYTRLANITIIDPDTDPSLRNNVLSVRDERFEIRDGGLYLKEGVTFDAGEKIQFRIFVNDENKPSLGSNEQIKTVVVAVPAPAPVTLSGDTLTLNLTGSYDFTKNIDGGWHIVAGSKTVNLTQAQALSIKNIDLHGGNDVDFDNDVVHGIALNVDGSATDTVNISGVTFTESAAGVSVGSNTDVSGFRIDIPLLVNGSITDTFKAVWNYLDDAYAYLQGLYGNSLMFGENGYSEAVTLADGKVILGETTNGAAALAVNKAVATLNIAYATYLNDGGSPNDLVDFMAKTNIAGTRAQAIHDNLLGAVSYVGITDRNFSPEDEDAFLAAIPGDYGTRPYASGSLDAYGHTDAGTNAAKAWDYERGVERPDYVTHFTGPIDPSGTRPNGEMWFGDGNPSTGYTIAVHDGEGIEFGWNVHYRQGDQIAGELGDDGLMHFEGPAGQQVLAPAHNVSQTSTTRSAVSLDYGIVSGLNGTNETIADYVIKVQIDRDPSAATSYKAFTMTSGGTGINYLLADDSSGGMGDDERDAGKLNPYISENSMNFGFGFLTNSQTANSGDFQAGTYDVIAEVWDDGILLFTNHIVLDLSNPMV